VRLAQRSIRSELADRPWPALWAGQPSGSGPSNGRTKAMYGMRKIVIAELEDAVAAV